MNEVAVDERPVKTRSARRLGPLSADAAKLVEDHLHLIPALTSGMAAHYPRHADREELAQAAALGLVEAALRFDPERGVPFDRWAVTRVRGAVVDAIRAIDFAPRSVRSKSRHIDAAQESLSQALGRTPTSKELAATLKMSLRQLDDHRARRDNAFVLSLDATTSSFEGSSSGIADVLVEADAPTPDVVVDEAESFALVGTAVRLLPERLRTVIDGYFVRGRTSMELAEELGVTESRVSQMRAEGLAMLRHALAGPLERTASNDPIGRRAARSRDVYAAAVTEEAAAAARGRRSATVAGTAADGRSVSVNIPLQRQASPVVAHPSEPIRSAA